MSKELYKEEILSLWNKGESKAGIAKALIRNHNLSHNFERVRKWVRMTVDKHLKTLTPVTPATASKPNISRTETSESIELTAKRIKSLDDLIKECDIDTKLWVVDKYTANKWDMGAVVDGVIITEPLYQIKASLKRKTLDQVDYEFIGDTVIDQMLQHSPKYQSFERPQYRDSHLLVIDPADCHFGKLASSYEIGSIYNIATAKQRVKEGFYGILDKGERFKIDRVKVMIGNDILHIDTPKRTTTSGTPQDTDGMFYDMFNSALETYVEVIDSIVKTYDVDLVFNSSNHDYMSGWMLAKSLEAWYRNCDNVNVDSAITHRKYYQYGNNLIASSHGDGAKMQDMPLLMANEAPDLWAKTKYRYVYLHHIHHYDKNKFKGGKDYVGVTVEYLRSPSESDSWHARNGYTGSPKAVEGFLHHKEYGQTAKFTHYF